MNGLRITTLPGRYAVCRLPPGDSLPDWVTGTLVSITRTPDELSVICDEECVPGGVRREPGWVAMHVQGPIPFETTGVAAGLTSPLAAEGISVLLVATFDTDYLLVRDEAYARATEALRRSGFLLE